MKTFLNTLHHNHHQDDLLAAASVLFTTTGKQVKHGQDTQVEINFLLVPVVWYENIEDTYSSMIAVEIVKKNLVRAGKYHSTLPY